MIRTEDDCVGCGIPPCKHCQHTAFICDFCDEEVDELYDYEGEQVCYKCMEEDFTENWLKDYLKRTYRQITL